MYSYMNRQFLLKQSTQVVHNFFYDTALGLCHSSLNRRNLWSDPIVIAKNLHRNFFVNIDKQDIFHAVFQDLKGNINYSFVDGSNIQTQPILNSKTSNIYNKHLHIIPFQNNINIFFVIYHENTIILSHQTIIAGKISPPKAIDYVIDNVNPYTVIHDSSENIYVFYQTSDGNNLQIGYKKYISAKQIWNEFIPITHYNGNCEFPNVIIDNNDIMHICYQRTADKQFELVYQQKIPSKNIWTDEIVIHTSNYSFDEASIVSTEKKLIIYWVRNDVIYYNYSTDIGMHWSKPARYNFSSGKQLICFNFKSNSTYDLNKIICTNIPGVFFNGYKLAFYQESSTDAKNLTGDDLKNLILDSMNLLKDNIEVLKGSNVETKDRVHSIEQFQKKMERDIIKFQVKYDDYEKEVNKLRSTILTLKEEINTLVKKNSKDIQSIRDLILNDILNSEIFKKLGEDLFNLKSEMENQKNFTE